MRSIATILLAIFISGAVSTDNRAAMSAKAVTLGVTFYTAAQIQTILQCIDPQIFAAPTDTTALITVGKNCIINNSGSKALAALSLYTNINSCLNPDDILTLAEGWATPFLKLTKTLTNKIVKNLKACKKAGTAQEACLQKMYVTAKAAITKAYVNKICTKFVKQNLSAKQYACAIKYAPQVVTVTGYKCATLTIT
ncbi:DUF19 domain-containing protein [Caenorhabditis elegans]|uniref:DUF19 domain-containing protein n=1 Tax=Caenorhabditis elegans TaxID=6239 RepID=Q9XWT9_CAEEL|nr:DUF19 domain-containing protein [Caenorhabditis elegans]CAA21555.2 DUF19 domain-containing protein [Caenorhabditis elegans]|eukprot:NP_507919.2 Uncharacterized protein CELE_Y38H6A.1 [Caenorhabditis elegans]